MTEAAIQTGQNAAAGAGQGQPAGAAAGQGSAAGTPGSPSPAAAAAANGAASDTPWYAVTFTDPAVRQAIHTGGFKNADEFGKAYVETKSLVGRKGVPVPGADAPFEERAKALAEFGRPAKPEEYKFAYPEGYTPSDTDKAYEGAMRKAMYDAGAPAFLAEKLVSAHMEHVGKLRGEIQSAQAAEAKAGEAAIGEWEAGIRKSGGDPTKAKALAQQAWQTILPPDSPLRAKLESALAEPGKAGSGAAMVVDLFHRFGSMISESGGVLKPGAGGKSFGPLSPQAAQAEIKAIRDAAMTDPKHPYVNNLHPEHAAVQKRMMELYTIGYPGMTQEQ